MNPSPPVTAPEPPAPAIRPRTEADPGWAATPRRPVRAAIAGLGAAFPQSITQAEAWETYFSEHYGGSRGARAIWRRCGVERRHHVVDPRVESDLPNWTTEQRMRRFGDAAFELSLAASKAALQEAELEASDVGHLTVVSCTGYGLPGVDIRLVHELRMRPETQRLHIGHMGCGGAVPGLTATTDAATARGKVGLLICVELPSLHIQPANRDVEQALTHALFSDAASAVAVVPGAAGLEIVDFASVTDGDSMELARLDITDHGFVMGLSTAVPGVIRRHVEETAEAVLARNGLAMGDLAAWAVHPGGPAVLDAVEERLELPPAALEVSRAVLREHGNCSSATVLVVLEEICRRMDLARGEHVMLMAFSPGITLHAVLLRQT